MMKFAALIVAALPTAFAIPEGFLVQCCLGVSPTPAEQQTFVDNTRDNFSGKDDPRCLTPCANPSASVMGADAEDALKNICLEFATPPSGAGVTLCPDKLHCCQTDAPGSETLVPGLFGFPFQTVGDAPWACGANLGPGHAGMAGDDGYYCGPLEACKFLGAVCGDPHFQTWSGDWYDFHGQCDLVFAKDEDFATGLGLAIHLRTTARYEYSFVETAAIKIGDDVLEVSGYGEYVYNGVENGKLQHKMGDIFRIEHEVVSKKKHTFNIIISEDKDNTEKIQITTFKDLVAVKFDGAYEMTYGKTAGMMGDFATGAKLGRDGKTVIEDADEFGMEWQVRAEEPMLFQATRSPQLSAGEQCVMPSKSAAVERRRLGETVPLEAAIAACEAVDHIHPENCIYDVMATGDLEIAHAGVF